jgi:sulfite reductase beta subunit-like hemoprotein
MGMATAISAHLAATDGRVEDLGPFRIRISGCPNSCGQHHVGDIGLTGMSFKGDDGQEHPHYSILVGGRVGDAAATVGKRLAGKFAEDQVPKVVAALAESYRTERTAGEPFGDFVQRVGVAHLNEVTRQVSGGAS